MKTNFAAKTDKAWVTEEQRVVIQTKEHFRGALLVEHKDWQANIDPAGGFLVGGTMLDEIIRAEAVASAVRRLARVLPRINMDSIDIPSQESLMPNATWVTELDAGTLDGSTPFGKRHLHPNPLAKRIRVSRKLLRQQPFAEQWVPEAMGEAVGVAEELAFIQGSGAGEPEGLINAPSLPTTTTAAAGVLALDDVRLWRYGLAGRYQNPNTRILCHTDFLAALSRLDTAGQNIGLDNGTIFNVAYEVSDQFPSGGTAPATQTSGRVIAIIGDFRAGFWIQDAELAEVTRLEELYAATNEVGFHIRRELDAMVVNVNAFRALKIQ